MQHSSVAFVSRLRVLGALVLLGYVALLAFAAPEGFPQSEATGAPFPYLSDQPLGEDGYYMLLAAWNLGAGHGLSANFGAAVTGVQPLMTLLLAALAWLVQAFGADKFALARMVILLGGVNLLLFAAVISRLARAALNETADQELAATLAFIGAATSFYLLRTFTYGLETGLYLALAALTMLVTMRVCDGGAGSSRTALGVGALVGLCGLARIDFGLVASIAFVSLLAQRSVTAPQACLAGLVALGLTAPWFVWVHGVSGSFMPTSGPAQAALVTLSTAGGRGEAMGWALLHNLAPWWSGGASALEAAALIIALGALWIATGAPSLRRIAWRPRSVRVLGAWTLAFVALPIVYVTFFWAAHFYARYTALLAISALVFTAALASSAPPQRRAGVAAAAFLILLGSNATAAYMRWHTGGVSDGHAVTAGYVAAHLPPDRRVGAFQSGVVGFFNANVVNLDGKVNQDALKALRANDIESYLDREKIDYVVDWEGVIRGFMGDALASGRWVLCATPVNNALSICVRRSDAPESSSSQAP